MGNRYHLQPDEETKGVFTGTLGGLWLQERDTRQKRYAATVDHFGTEEARGGNTFSFQQYSNILLCPPLAKPNWKPEARELVNMMLSGRPSWAIDQGGNG